MSNIDITPYIHEYRNTIIPIWQSLARYKIQEYDWDLCDEFADICERLFFLMVLRPNGISGITKSKQYDQIPAGIPSLIAVPVPDTSEILAAENNNGAYIWRVEKYTKEENQTFIFVDLVDFDLNASDRNFDYLLTKIIKPYPAEPNDQYPLLPIKTTKILLISEN